MCDTFIYGVDSWISGVDNVDDVLFFVSKMHFLYTSMYYCNNIDYWGIGHDVMLIRE